MRSVIYSMGVSLDGFIAGPGGEIDWGAPDEELHRFHNQQTRAIGAYMCGRSAHASPVMAEFARIWRAIPKVVFSTTLSSVEGNARLATNSLADEVAMHRDLPDDRVVSVGGARLAAGLTQLDLIDEYRQFISPLILGGGTPYFPPLDHPLDLELLETPTFGSRVIYARYRRIRAG